MRMQLEVARILSHYQLALLAPDLLNLRGWGELARELGTVPRALSAGETTGAQKGEVNCPKPWDPKLGLEAFTSSSHQNTTFSDVKYEKPKNSLARM